MTAIRTALAGLVLAAAIWFSPKLRELRARRRTPK